MFWTALASWGVQAINLVVFVVLARLLDPGAFGLIALAGVYIHVSAIFVDQGLGTAITQRKNLDPEHLDAAFWMSVTSGLLLAGLGVVCSGIVATFFNEPQLRPVVALLSLNFLFTSLNGVQRGLLSREFAFRDLAVRSVVATSAGGIVGVAMALGGMGVMSLVALELIASATGVLLLWSLASWRPRFSFSRPHARELLSFGGNIIGIRLLNVLSKRSDDALIGYFLGSVALGYYAVGYKLFKVLLDVFARIFTKVAVPAFASIQADRNRVREAFYRSATLLALVCFPPFVILGTLAPDIIPVAFGDQWLPSAPVMQVLAFLGLVQCMYLLTHQLHIACGKPHWTLGFLAVSTILSVCGFLLTVEHGIVAVAAAYAVVGYLMIPVQVGMLRRLIGFRLADLLRWLRAPVLGSVSLAGTCLVVRHSLVEVLGQKPGVIATAVLGIAAYGLVIVAIQPELLAEVRRLGGRRERAPRSSALGPMHGIEYAQVDRKPDESVSDRTHPTAVGQTAR